MRRLLGVLLSFGMVAAFCGCTGGDAKTTASSATATSVAVASSAKVAASVEMVYFGSPG